MCSGLPDQCAKSLCYPSRDVLCTYLTSVARIGAGFAG